MGIHIITKIYDMVSGNDGCQCFLKETPISFHSPFAHQYTTG